MSPLPRDDSGHGGWPKIRLARKREIVRATFGYDHANMPVIMESAGVTKEVTVHDG